MFEQVPMTTKRLINSLVLQNDRLLATNNVLWEFISDDDKDKVNARLEKVLVSND